MDSDVIGELALLDDGTWSYVSDLPLPAKAGGLLLLKDAESGERHVFGVAKVTGWGAVLGRLDHNPISTRLRGSFGPANAAVCTGKADQRTCIDQAPKGTWFSIFETQDGAVVFENDIPARVARLRSGDPASDLWIKKASEWVAISDGVAPPSPALRVGLESDCSTQTVDFFALSAPMPGKHPLDVENQAYEHAVDAFVGCKNGRFQVAIPSAARPRLNASDIRLRTHPVLVVGQDDVTGSLNDVARFAAMVGVGDFDGAGLLLLKLAPENPRLALQGAEILAATGRPDEALALAYLSTKTAWNRDADFYWVFLRARVALVLGSEAGFVERWSRLPDMAQRLENNGVYGWVVWQAFEAETRGAAEYKTYDESLAGRELSKWRSLLRLVTAIHTQAEPDIASFLVGNPNTNSISKALRGEEIPKAGDGPLDVYGRLWSEGVRGDLTRVGGALFRPGYSHRPDDISGFEVLNLNKIGGQQARVDDLKTSLRCDAPPMPATNGLGLDAVAVWALTIGRSASCKSPADLQQVVAALSEEDRTATRGFVAVLFEQSLASHNNAQTLSSAAVWASSVNLGEVCRRWNLALGFSALISDHLDEAQSALVRANACASRDYDASEKQLSAAINWLRTGAVSGDFETQVRQRVMGVTRQVTTDCPLLSSWEVNLNELAEPVIRTHLVAMEPLAQEDFAVVTSTQHLTDARLAVAEFVAAMRLGDSATAAKTLQSMQMHFRAARHLPGQRFVELLEQVIFEGRLSEFAAGPPATKKEKTVATKLRAGKFLDTKGWNPSQLSVVEFLVTGDPAMISKAKRTDFSAELCALPMPRTNDGPIDLDADF
jgi:hypothetical protein